MSLDQATGLRRMLGGVRLRVLPLAGVLPGEEQSRLAACLAAGLASSGERVLLLDATGVAGPGAARYELSHLLQGEREFGEVARPVCENLRVLGAAKGLAMLADAPPARWRELFLGFARLGEPPDTVVLACAPGDALPACRAAGAGKNEVILALGHAATAVTRAYGLIKSACREHGQRRFGLLFSRVPSSFDARPVAARMDAVARRFADAEVRLAGVAAAPDSIALVRASARWSLPEFQLQQ